MYKEEGREECLVEENMVGEGEGLYQRIGSVGASARPNYMEA